MNAINIKKIMLMSGFCFSLSASMVHASERQEAEQPQEFSPFETIFCPDSDVHELLAGALADKDLACLWRTTKALKNAFAHDVQKRFTLRKYWMHSHIGSRVLPGHNDINSVVISPDGKLLASASGDKTMRLWSIATGQSIREFQGHNRSVSSVAISPDGKLVASGSDEPRLWDVETGQSAELLGHSNWVFCVVFSYDGKLLASGSHDSTIRLWNGATGQSIRELRGHTGYVKSVVFLPDGNLLASGSGDRTIRLWNVKTGQSRVLQGHNGPALFYSNFA